MKKALNWVSAGLSSGFRVPQALDIQAKEASFRLWCANISFHMALCSIAALHIWPVSIATWTTIGFFGLCMVFYTLKKLTKAKIDLNDGELELSDDSEKKVDSQP